MFLFSRYLNCQGFLNGWACGSLLRYKFKKFNRLAFAMAYFFPPEIRKK
jgi:hypothetical protein